MTVREPAWLQREAALLEGLGEHLREAQAAHARGDAQMRDAALQAASKVHAELGGVLREGAGYICGFSMAQLRSHGRSRPLESKSIH